MNSPKVGDKFIFLSHFVCVTSICDNQTVNVKVEILAGIIFGVFSNKTNWLEFNLAKPESCGMNILEIIY